MKKKQLNDIKFKKLSFDEQCKITGGQTPLSNVMKPRHDTSYVICLKAFIY